MCIAKQIHIAQRMTDLLCISDSQKQLLLETRPIRVIKGMFLQGHLYHVSFPQVKFQMPAP